MEAASIISERSLEISFASALSTVSASGLNVNAGDCHFMLAVHTAQRLNVSSNACVALHNSNNYHAMLHGEWLYYTRLVRSQGVIMHNG